MPRLPDLFPEAGPARRGMRGWRIPLGRGRVCARASALQKCRCPRAVFLPCSVVAVVGRGGNPVFAGAGAFPATRGMFKRPSAALPAGGEPSEGAVFFAELPRRSNVCAGPRFSAPARSAGNRETSRAAVLRCLCAGRSLSVFPSRRTSAQAGRAPVAEGQVGSDLRHRSCGVAS